MLSNTSLYLSPCSCPILGGSSITAWATTPLLPKRGSSLSSIYLTCVCLEAWPEYIFPDGLVTTKNWNVISIIHCVEGAKTCILHEACIVRQTALSIYMLYFFPSKKHISWWGREIHRHTSSFCVKWWVSPTLNSFDHFAKTFILLFQRNSLNVPLSNNAYGEVTSQ